MQALLQVLEVVRLGHVARGNTRAKEVAAPVAELGEGAAFLELQGR